MEEDQFLDQPLQAPSAPPDPPAVARQSNFDSQSRMELPEKVEGGGSDAGGGGQVPAEAPKPDHISEKEED